MKGIFVAVLALAAVAIAKPLPVQRRTPEAESFLNAIGKRAAEAGFWDSLFNNPWESDFKAKRTAEATFWDSLFNNPWESDFKAKRSTEASFWDSLFNNPWESDFKAKRNDIAERDPALLQTLALLGGGAALWDAFDSNEKRDIAIGAAEAGFWDSLFNNPWESDFKEKRAVVAETTT